MGDSKTSVSFACQRCLQPLVLEESFAHMSVHALAELACKYLHIYYRKFSNIFILIEQYLVPIYANNEVELDLQATSLDHFVPPFRLTDSGTHSSRIFRKYQR